MKTETVDFKNFDDLVFENRNKDYGAYAIRRSYSDNANKAVLVAILASGLIILLPSVFSSGNAPIIIDKRTVCPLNVDNVPIIIEVTPPKQTPHIRSVNNNFTTVATTNIVEPEKPVTQTSAVTSEGDDTGEPLLNDGDGLVSTAVVISEPAVVKKPEIILAAEQMPQYVGGVEAMARYLQRKLKYPSIARRMGIQGIVYVSFVINADGSVIMTNVLKGISKECDEEAKRVISMMPPWIAGRQNKTPVSVRMTLPIKFQLAE